VLVRFPLGHNDAVTGPWNSNASAPLDGSAVTLVEGSSFAISLPSGDMLAGHPHGLFCRDTRFLSELRLRVNGRSPEPLGTHVDDPFSATFVVQAVPEPGRADSNLIVARQRYVGHGMREDITVQNFSSDATICGLDLAIDCDFADLFEVKEGRIEKTGDISVAAEPRHLVFTYVRGTFHRATRVAFSEMPLLAETASFEVIVPPGGKWTLCVEITPVINGDELVPRHRCGDPVEHAVPSRQLETWRQRLPRATVEHEGFAHLLKRSTEDLASLRLFDPELPDRPVVAAGAPWFMTVFGRDSLIASWMALLVDTDLALGTLETLARHQGRDVDPVTEEEPGRILHEMRFGESASLSLGGGSVYYGSIDATPLFVMLLGQLRRWHPNRDAVDALLPAGDLALAWIDEFGDRDGDGYVEYLRSSDRGLRNQGWKDAWDSTNFADGHLAEPPIALCEVQGYVYAALLARADFAVDAEDAALAGALTERAAQLKERFNRDFWLDEQEWYAMGLDRDKVPIDAVVSNIGHCLWTGIIDRERVPSIARRLVSDELFSGWGVRTLASTMTRYNPISYQNGSVWPHDNALCVAGLMRYGLHEEAHRIMQGVVDAGHYFRDRLPELYGGFARDEYPFPVAYPTACSPQAWAAASPLLFLRAVLGFEPDLPQRRVAVEPTLPAWIGRLRLEGLPIGHGQLSLEAVGDQLEVIHAPDGLTVAPAQKG
jgi:glycogen debranching enzyme